MLPIKETLQKLEVEALVMLYKRSVMHDVLLSIHGYSDHKPKYNTTELEIELFRRMGDKSL